MLGAMHFAMSISELDQGFLAGFLEGDACFEITEMNAGQSHSCKVSVRVRDDDQDLLEWLVANTGLGRLYRVPARATSRAQIGWGIERQEDCLELGSLLSRCGFHGRRAAELEIWSAALDAWTRTNGAHRRATMQELRRRLGAARRYGEGSPRALPLPGRLRLRLGYISGLVAAEGSFGFSNSRPRFSMHLRHDDKPLLALLAASTGLGRIYDHTPTPPLNPSSRWTLFASGDLAQLIALLREADLPGRKRAEMETWAIAVEELEGARRVCSPPRPPILGLAREQLRALRTYRPSTHELLTFPERDLRAESIEALRLWSQLSDGPLTCTAYARWRREHPTRPTRNTVARSVGGWQAALVAAGLGDRVASAARPAGGAARRALRREEQRERVIAAVRRFANEHGRLPRAMEFFR
jgi:hypothetical protein